MNNRILTSYVSKGLDLLLLKHDVPLALPGVESDIDDGVALYEPTKSFDGDGDNNESLEVNIEGQFMWKPSDDYYTSKVIDTELLIGYVNALSKNDELKEVTFKVNSPGGDARGIKELHEAVNNLASKKTVKVHNIGNMCSAAYYGFCGAQEISADVGTITGSIGCYSLLATFHRMFESWGIDIDLISSGGVKGQGSPILPISDEYKQQVQANVNEIAAEFRNAVLSSRTNVNSETAFNGYHWGPEKARTLGLIDKANTLNESEDTAMNDELKSMLEKISTRLTMLEAKEESKEESKVDEAKTEAKTEQLSDEVIDLLMDKGRAEGKIVPGNQDNVRAVISGLSLDKAKETINLLSPVIKTNVVSEPDSEPEHVKDIFSEAFNGAVTQAQVDKFKNGRKYSVVTHALTDYNDNIIEVVKPKKAPGNLDTIS